MAEGELKVLLEFMKMLESEIKVKKSIFKEKLKDIAETYGVKQSYILRLINTTDIGDILELD